jgi:hypothetical protein
LCPNIKRLHITIESRFAFYEEEQLEYDEEEDFLYNTILSLLHQGFLKHLKWLHIEDLNIEHTQRKLPNKYSQLMYILDKRVW